MQAIDQVTGLTDRVESTMRATSDRFERLAHGQDRVLWKHAGIPSMVLCVEQDGTMERFDQNGGEHDLLLVGEESDPDNLYPFDDVCSCWAWDWGKGDVARRIDRCVEASIKYATQGSELAETDDPPEPVLSLAESLELVDEHADELKKLFSAAQIDGTRTRLRETRQSLYERIGLDFGHASE